MAVVCGGAENKSNIVALVVGQWTRVGIFSCVACKKNQIHKTLGSVRHAKCYGNHTNRFQKLFICFFFCFFSIAPLFSGNTQVSSTKKRNCHGED